MMSSKSSIFSSVNSSIVGADAKPRSGARKRLLIVLSLSLLTLCSVSVRGQADDGLWKIYMDAAGQAIQNKNYDEAEKLYKLAEGKAKEFGELDERYVSTLANQVGLYLLEKKYAEADAPYKQLLAILEKGAGGDSLNSASLVSSLANAFHNEKRYKEAEPLYKYALATYKRGMKPGDKGVINYIHFLGDNYFDQNKLKEAEDTFKQELAILEGDPVLSKQMNFVYTLGYLSLIAQRFKKDDEAEGYLKRAIDVVKSLRGENHPETASMIQALAIILLRQETRFMDAVRAMQQVIQIDEAVYGKTSKKVASDLNSLAFAYRYQGKYDEALPMEIRAVDMLNAIPDTSPSEFSNVASNLSYIYSLKRNYAEGEAVCKSMNGVFEKRSQRSPETDLLVNDCLQSVYLLSGNYPAEAEALQSLIAIDEKLGAQKDDELAQSLTDLASSFLRQKKYDDAITALRRAEKIYNKDPATPNDAFLNLMARYYYFTGKYAESEPYFLKAIALLEPKKDLFIEQDLAAYRKNYALSLYAQGKTSQAAEMFRQAIDVFKRSKIFGERNISTSYHELATLFTAQGKYAEAEPLFKQAIEIREKVLGANHPELAASLEGYAALLRKTGRAAEAAPLESRAQAIRVKQSSR